MSQNSEPDWDSINRGKVRHFFALELYKYKLDTEGYSMSLKPSEKGIIDMFVSYVMDGDDEKDESISERLMSERNVEL